MPFGLANAPATFQRFINYILREFLDIFVSAYIDDVLIFTNGSRTEHIAQVNLVIQHLREAGLTIDIDKCEFETKQIKYLGFILEPGKISMDHEKVAAVEGWETPRSVKDVQAFLGFANFYRRFIKDFSKISAPLTDLTKKTGLFQWTEEATAAFKELKHLFTSGPILQMFDPDRRTILETDASGYSIGAVLLQPNDVGILHPCAYMSKKMRPGQANYPIHDKELLAIIEAFKEWRAELKSVASQFEVISDHKNLQHFTVIQHLSERQARWSLFLSEFNFKITHRPGRLSSTPDALSRRYMPEGEDDPRYEARNQQLLASEEDGSLVVTTRRTPGELNLPASPFEEAPLSELWERALESDTDYMVILEAVRKGDRSLPPQTQHHLRIQLSECSLDPSNRLLFRQRIWVPKFEPLRTAIIQRMHDSHLTVHPGKNQLQSELSRQYFWPNYGQDVRRFLRNCEVCGSTAIWRDAKAGLLKPLDTPERIWSEIGIDFIGPLPMVSRNGVKYSHAMTIVDRLSKGVVLLPVVSTKMEDTVTTFLTGYYPRHGLPTGIVSDREFANAFWKRACQILGINRRLTTAYHPESNGADERMNAEIKMKIAKLGGTGKDWLDLLPIVEFSINSAPAASTGLSPFFLQHGYHPTVIPLTPLPWHPLRQHSPIEAAERIVKKLQEGTTWARTNIEAAKLKMEEQANQKRKAGPNYQPGDWVWLRLRPEQQGAGLGRKLRDRQGKYRIIEQVGSHSYRLDLGSSSTAHNVFHIDRLRPAGNDPFPSQILHDYRPPPVTINNEPEYEIEEILRDRVKDGKKEYQVKWRGYRRPTWEPEDAVEDTTALEDYLAREGG